MSAEAHAVDTLLRDLTGDPSPSPSDVLAGRRLLASAIAAEARPLVRRRSLDHAWWRRISVAASAVALVVAVVAVTGLLRPQPVTALGELAHVAERVEPVALSGGQYLYTRSFESQLIIVTGAEIGLVDRAYAAYSLPIVRDRWVDEDGGIYEEVSVGAPEFFDDAVEAAYGASGLAEQDGVGTTEISEFTPEATVLGARNWPTDPAALRDAMRAYASNQGRDISDDAALVELAGNLLRATGASPALRAAVIGVLDDLDVDVTTRSAGSGLVVALDYQDEVRARLILEFDDDANLVRDQLVWLEDAPSYGVPAGTAFFDTQLSPSRVVGSLTQP